MRFIKLSTVVLGSILLVGTANADIVHNDDVIVTFSQCVGNDCVSGESFGFDTVRLKENNLRIKFQDTSTTASFPRRDWQITANDSSNGGQEKFSIDDIDGGRTPFTIEAGAPSHSLYVDDGGRLGLGTNSPVVDVHVVSGNTPTLRLEQDGSSGFTPQTWDVAGNEANFFIRDVTNGSKLPLKIKPGAPTGTIFMAADGDVGIGTESPTGDLSVGRTSGNVDIDISTSGNDWRLRANATTGQLNIIDNTNGTTPLKIASSASTNLVQMGVNAANRVDITGSLFINGTDNSTPDYVFEPDYDLKTIEEHAKEMWENKSLPFVGPGVTGEDGKAVIDMVQRAQGSLEELELAHIYIEKLNTELKDKNNEISQLENRLAAIEKALDIK